LNGVEVELLGTTRDVTFGQFDFDLLTGELRKSHRRVRLAEQSERILKAPLERPGDLVTHPAGKAAPWVTTPQEEIRCAKNR